MDNQVKTTKDEILSFVRENDVKFIRLSFCDLFGSQKNVSIMPDELENAFADGIPFDASAISGFSDIANSDLFLKPEPATITLLPWRPQQGRVARFYCSVVRPDGGLFEYDSRELLKRAAYLCKEKGFECKIGAECEFYLFKTDENGDPTSEPFDRGSYFDMAPMDKGENVRREICIVLEDMGLHPESSHHEQGPGQNEIDFTFSDALTSADEFMTFKTAVKVIAARNGLFASFMPKPLLGQSGSGMHINISLFRNGENIFQIGNKHYGESESFIAGVLSKAAEMSLFLNPIPNSYDRLGQFRAPGYVSWSKNNRSQLIRIPAASGVRSRMELRSPDASINPYLAYALIIYAGIYGIENKLRLPNPADFDLYSADEKAKSTLQRLPTSLLDAITLAESSEFIKNTLGKNLLQKYVEQKRNHAEEYEKANHKSNINALYFPLI